MDISIVYLLGFLTTLLGISANAFVALLFQKLKRLDIDTSELRREIIAIRLNYLDRFDDVKEHQYKLHLDIKEKIGILETLMHKNFLKK